LRRAAAPGLDGIRWLKPVRPGEHLRMRCVAPDARPMESKPQIGLLRKRREVPGQNGEKVMQMLGYGMMRRGGHR